MWGNVVRQGGLSCRRSCLSNMTWFSPSGRCTPNLSRLLPRPKFILDWLRRFRAVQVTAAWSAPCTASRVVFVSTCECTSSCKGSIQVSPHSCESCNVISGANLWVVILDICRLRCVCWDAIYTAIQWRRRTDHHSSFTSPQPLGHDCVPAKDLWSRCLQYLSTSAEHLHRVAILP